MYVRGWPVVCCLWLPSALDTRVMLSSWDKLEFPGFGPQVSEGLVLSQASWIYLTDVLLSRVKTGWSDKNVKVRIMLIPFSQAYNEIFQWVVFSICILSFWVKKQNFLRGREHERKKQERAFPPIHSCPVCPPWRGWAIVRPGRSIQLSHGWWAPSSPSHPHRLSGCVSRGRMRAH